MSGNIILCADDYGLAPGVSRAIRMLAAAGRISATSALVTMPQWPREAEALKPLLGSIAAGLHLNLTLGTPLSAEARSAFDGRFPGRTRLIVHSLLRRLKTETVIAEIEHQFDAFEKAIGSAPDLIDGHEHVHTLANVRTALFHVLKRRYGDRPILIRDPSLSWPQIGARHSPLVKSLVLSVLARTLRGDIQDAGFIANDAFAGITAFTPSASAVQKDFANAAKVEGWRPLVMCHPGFPDADLARIDPITKRRQFEFDALMQPTPAFRSLWRPRRTADGHIAWPVSAMEATA